MTTQPPLDSPFHRLRDLRTRLLRLHKALLDSERIVYERNHGRIKSKGEFFQLVIGDGWFSWLRVYSQFIVQIDEALSDKETMTLDQATALLSEANTLLSANETGSLQEQRYCQAIQRDPAIAYMHAELSNFLNGKK
ncbi:MAG: hypothetical protein AAF327_16815 [Cyanobacteria bacterium P01_A01_bin.37]